MVVMIDDDPLLAWAAQGMRTGVRTWTLGDAAAVACPGLSRFDRLAVRGSVADVTELIRRIRPEVDGYRPVGDEELITKLPVLHTPVAFGWMDATSPTGIRSRRARWLVDDAEVAAFLDTHHPHSYARPGAPGVTRWAGIRDDEGALLGVAADACSAPGIGFLGGVATRSDARGRGVATELCAFVTDELIAAYGRVALMVGHGNAAAVRTYEKLGYTMRRIAAATLGASG